MTATVLVPYDGSDRSEQALAAAVDTFPDAAIVALHVVEPVTAYMGPAYGGQQHEQAIADAEEELAAAVEGLGRTVETAVVTGRPVHEIVRYAEENGVTHIVMGSHGRDGAQRLLLGSVAETVLRRASVPVTIVREGGPVAGDPGRVLVPFDGSAEARRALAHATEQYPDAEITALYVAYPPRDVLESGEPDEDWSPDEFAAEILAMAETGEGDVRTDTAEGKPAAAVVTYVEENEIDHVVMGSHGRDGLTRLLLGSVAETVARRSPTSVTVVR